MYFPLKFGLKYIFLYEIYIKTNIFINIFGSFSAVIAVPFLTKLCKFIRRSICPRNFYLNIHAKYSNKTESIIIF